MAHRGLGPAERFVEVARARPPVCCYAEKTETWVDGPDDTRWEWYVKRADAEQFENEVIGCCGPDGCS